MGAMQQEAAAKADPCRPADPRYHAFFDKHYNIVAEKAAALGLDPALLLGLAAHESTWGTSNLAGRNWNPFGATPKGKPPMAF